MYVNNPFRIYPPIQNLFTTLRIYSPPSEFNHHFRITLHSRFRYKGPYKRRSFLNPCSFQFSSTPILLVSPSESVLVPLDLFVPFWICSKSKTSILTNIRFLWDRLQKWPPRNVYLALDLSSESITGSFGRSDKHIKYITVCIVAMFGPILDPVLALCWSLFRVLRGDFTITGDPCCWTSEAAGWNQ